MGSLTFDEALGLWVAADAATVQAAFAHRSLRVRPPDEPVPKALQGRPAGEVFALLVRMNDGQFHARHRPQVEARARAFPTADAVHAGADAAHALAHAAPDEVLSLLPALAMAQLLGVPPAECESTARAAVAFAQGIAPGAAPYTIARADEAATLLMAQGAGRGLDAVASANRIALMQQAVDACAALLGLGVLALRREGGPPDTGFVEEVARFDAPIRNTRRFAAQDMEFAGVPLARGQGLLLDLQHASRDPALNDAPDRFDRARTARRMLVFGAGAHACCGQALAVALVTRALGVLDTARWQHTGWRPLPNARIPTFQ